MPSAISNTTEETSVTVDGNYYYYLSVLKGGLSVAVLPAVLCCVVIYTLPTILAP